MSQARNRFNEALLRRKFEESFRKSRTFRIGRRAIFYLGFCPLILFSAFAVGVSFGGKSQVAGLVGGLLAIPLGLFLWMRLWSWTKQISFVRWRRNYEAK